MRRLLPIAFGLLVGVSCFLFSLGLAGAGHGWSSAWPFGSLSIALFPLAFYNWVNYQVSSREGSVVMLVIAGLLNAALFFLAYSEGLSYFEKVLVPAWIWIAFWSTWQLVVLRTAFIAPTLRQLNGVDP